MMFEDGERKGFVPQTHLCMKVTTPVVEVIISNGLVQLADKVANHPFILVNAVFQSKLQTCWSELRFKKESSRDASVGHFLCYRKRTLISTGGCVANLTVYNKYLYFYHESFIN
jgi:hypothetical protein